jgi:hypothetical protein
MACPGGETRCGGICVSTMKDDLNCGACGVRCPPSGKCAAGKCRGGGN